MLHGYRLPSAGVWLFIAGILVPAMAVVIAAALPPGEEVAQVTSGAEAGPGDCVARWYFTVPDSPPYLYKCAKTREEADQIRGSQEGREEYLQWLEAQPYFHSEEGLRTMRSNACYRQWLQTDAGQELERERSEYSAWLKAQPGYEAGLDTPQAERYRQLNLEYQDWAEERTAPAKEWIASCVGE
ncbi:MAG: hypothetical protein GEU73_02135 [Chloroflexi bacterium]|nr:hypothetical protein [Chloroflexota bacterium]